MNRTDELSTLIDDFVFHERRVADQPAVRVSVFLAEGEVLRLVARSRSTAMGLPEVTYRLGQGLTGRVFSNAGFTVPSNMSNRWRDTASEYSSFIGCPIVVGNQTVGALSFDCQTQLPLSVPRPGQRSPVNLIRGLGVKPLMTPLPVMSVEPRGKTLSDLRN